MILRRVLIANRGEIAVRIIATCQRLGIETVLAASEADLDSLAARLADRTLCIGAAPASASYLNVGAVVAAARASGSQAVHPGYGFLAENRRLAEACIEAGIVFIGPTPDQLTAVGDKLSARTHAVQAGLPVVPGGEAATPEQALAVAQETGWPVLIKAVGGGGGRGMKVAADERDLRHLFGIAAAEARAAFGDPRLYVERFVPRGRHVEVQILGDGEEVIHLGTRDCSIQRRYQKLVEEAPAPDLSAPLREALHAAAVAFGRHLRYRGLGTVEFLVDSERDAFYFLEMNARIQVEHPVTEAITGLDLVEQQIAVAEGRRLALSPESVTFTGHAVECRVNAEDWEHDFRPSPGTIAAARFPAGPGIRVDTHVQAGAEVPPHYDSLLAKLIVHGRDRGEALDRLGRAITHCTIEGVVTNLPMHAFLLGQPEFRRGAVDTAWLSRVLESGAASHG